MFVCPASSLSGITVLWVVSQSLESRSLFSEIQSFDADLSASSLLEFSGLHYCLFVKDPCWTSFSLSLFLFQATTLISYHSVLLLSTTFSKNFTAPDFCLSRWNSIITLYIFICQSLNWNFSVRECPFYFTTSGGTMGNYRVLLKKVFILQSCCYSLSWKPLS